MSITTYNKFENPTHLSKSQLWLLATSSMFTELNKEFHDTLLPHHIYSTPELLKESKESLLIDWEINNSADFRDRLNFFHTQQNFAEVQSNVEFFSEYEFDQTQQFGNDRLDLRNSLDMIRNYQYDLKSSDSGFQYGLCSWMIRHALYNGFITEEETWNLLEENGKLIKKAFDSWESFGLSFLVGFQYSKRKEYNEVSMQTAKNNISYLLTNKNSPWLKTNWNDYE